MSFLCQEESLSVSSSNAHCSDGFELLVEWEHLERASSKCQLALFRRLASLMLADGPVDSFEVLRSGRRFHALVDVLLSCQGPLQNLELERGLMSSFFQDMRCLSTTLSLKSWNHIGRLMHSV